MYYYILWIVIHILWYLCKLNFQDFNKFCLELDLGMRWKLKIFTFYIPTQKMWIIPDFCYAIPMTKVFTSMENPLAAK